MPDLPHSSKDTSSYTIDDLIYLMARLRDPMTGCPWDLKQNFKTIAPHTLEEVYEVIDAIETEDYPSLKEELGDLLFQVVFYSQLGGEQSLFSLNDIITHLVKKLIIRHPHVFPDGTLSSTRNADQQPDEQQINQTWEQIKKAQRNDKGQSAILDDIPLSLPALTRATKLQKRAANHGFDWPNYEGVFEKIAEEIAELKLALDEGSPAEIEDELGDLLFSVVNLSRHLKVDSETALRAAAKKFEQRFTAMEVLANQQGRIFDELSLQEKENLWREVKNQP